MFTATLYNSTGFNSVNIPDSEAVLNASAESTKNVPTMDILQLYNNIKITIRAFEEDVICADYMKLTKEAEGTTPAKSAFYAINGYDMTSGDTINLAVTMCGILTAGGVAFLKQNAAFIDGTISRHHLTLQRNLGLMAASMPIEEDPLFTPSYPTKLELDDELFLPEETMAPYRSPSLVMLVSAAMDLDAANNVYEEQIGTEDPNTGEVNISTRKNFTSLSSVGGDIIRYDMPGTYDRWIYTTIPYNYTPGQRTSPIGGYPGVLHIIENQGDLEDFRKILVRLVANNMHSLIQDSWVAPSSWVNAISNSSAVTGMNRRAHIKFFEYEDNDQYVLDGTTEIGTLMGKYNQVVLVATGSGQIKELSPEDTLMLQFDAASGNDYFMGTLVTGMSDPRPEGGVSFAVGKRGEEWLLQDDQGDMNNLNAPRRTKGLILEKSEVIDGGKWYHVPINVIGQPGYNANKHLFDAQQQSKDLALDIQVQSGTMKQLGNPLGVISDTWNAFKEGNISGGPFGAIAQAGSALYGGLFGTDSYSSLYSTGGNMGMQGDIGRGVVAGNERAIAAANRQAEKAAELAQFRTSNAPQPVVVSKATGGLDLHGNALMVFKRSLDDRDEEKFTILLHKFGYKHTIPFDTTYLSNRQKYNYIECSGVSVKIPGFSKNVCSIVADELCNGVRIWHEKPFVINRLTTNPNAS